MKKVLLLCAAGMSTTIIEDRMKKAAKKRNVEMSVEALQIEQCKDRINSFDVILVAPQVRFQLSDIEKLVDNKDIVKVIDTQVYGTADGEGIVEFILDK